MNVIVNNWLNSASAEKFFQQEKKSFQRLSNQARGQMGIQLCMAEKNDYLANINVSSQYQVSHDVGLFSHETRQTENRVIARLEELPFESNEFAIVIVPQMNLFSEDSHAALREIYRVTASDGLIAVSGINPFSMMGVQAKFMPSKYPLLPTVSLGQMKVWLSLLGCEIVGGDLFHYSAMSHVSSYPRVARSIESIGNRWLPMASGGYWLLAKKRLFGQQIKRFGQLKAIKTGKIAGQVASKY
ncbi:MAG: class I SAM-dependent methyltransferase [Arenicella sp.]